MGEDQSIPPPESYLDAVFGAEGYLSRAIEGYRPREGQVALAHAVDEAVTGRRHLLAEGPTGVGKSLAYAAPASYHAARLGYPVVIVTANIALQEQIVEKDLPLLASVVPWKFTFALLKGRNNFLCTDRAYQEQANRQRSFGGGADNAEERRQLPIVRAWAQDTVRAGCDHETGDVSELPFEPLPSVWKRFSVGSDDCKRGRCKFRRACFANAASERAKQSRVIVTNYHMLFAHLAVYLESGADVVLPPFHVVVLDEAHKAADIARDFFGFRVSAGSTKRLTRALRGIDCHPEADALERATVEFFHVLSLLRRDQTRYKARLTGLYSPHETQAWQKMEGALGAALGVLRFEWSKLDHDYTAMKDAGAGMTSEAEELCDRIGELDVHLKRGDAILLGLTQAMKATSTEHVYYLQDDDRDRSVTVCSKLVHASSILGHALFDKMILEKHEAEPDEDAPEPDAFDLPLPTATSQARVTVIATSATLATDDNSFAYIAGELGVSDYSTFVAGSPFDWPRQALFIVPDGLPNPNDAEFRDAVARIVERTILLAGGRTLGLFTSRRGLEHTCDAVAGVCRKQGITLLKQGDAPRTQLIARFKSDVTSVLLGTESFWAGVDVPGEALSVVVIDRLPFPTPDDPVLDVLSATDDKWFFKYSVPRAIIAFKQGFGRLIRSMGDRGVVVCCDKRIVEKRYGKQFLRALPNIPKSTRLEALAEWLATAPAEEEVEAWDAL